MKEFDAYSVGVVCASVCTSLSVEEATRRLNQEYPTGISTSWELSNDESFNDGKTLNGSPCERSPDTHKHYLFNC